MTRLRHKDIAGLPANIRQQVPSAGRSKYGATRIEVDGILFDSKAEAIYYEQLKLLRDAGSIRYFLRQVPFDLPGNTKYRCDFMIVDDAGVQYVDIKGHVTKEFKRAKKQVEALYPVEIHCLRCTSYKQGHFSEIRA